MEKQAILLNNVACFDPYVNLASEEYLVRSKDFFGKDIIMLWQNEGSVIIGKNQNAFSQIDSEYVKSNGVKVVRRLTGGGAVFHDLGNLNYTFITDFDPNASFSDFAKPIVESLACIGLNAELTGRNDVCIDGKKISGTAMCAQGRRLMFHGTLLFSADLAKLSACLKVKNDKLKDKGIKSVISRVANIQSLTDSLKSVDDLREFLVKELSVRFNGGNVSVLEFDPREREEVASLYREKYSTWDWNFGSSPSFEYTCEKRYPFGSLELYVKTENGLLKDVFLYGDFFGNKDVSELCALLRGTRFDRNEIQKRLSAINVSEYVLGASAENISELFKGE